MNKRQYPAKLLSDGKHGILQATLIAALLLASALVTPHTEAENRSFTFIVACPLPPKSPSLKPLIKAFNEALEPQDAQVEIVLMPERRALDKLFRNEVDAVCAISRYSQARVSRDQAIILSSPLAKIQTIALYDPAVIDLNLKDLLSSRRYQVGYSSNSVSVKAYLQERKFTLATGIDHLKKVEAMLKSQRINVLLGLDIILYNSAFKQDFGHFQYQVLETQNVHPAIHPKHQAYEEVLNQQMLQLLESRGGPISIENMKNWEISIDKTPSH